jgi:anaerobic magnesium-protoporphyrin IX monomethyl ester cyclase
MSKHITIVDLNNFSFYPTQPIGIISSLLRNAGFQVSLISPLNTDVVSKPREGQEGKKDYWMSRLLTSEKTMVRKGLDGAMKIPYLYDSFYNKRKIFDHVKAQLNAKTNIVLVSSYFQNYNVCEKLGRYLKALEIPLVVGGPGFNDMSKMSSWLSLEGVTAIVATEAETFVVNLVNDVLANKPVSHYPGVYQSGKEPIPSDFILTDLDQIPIPDYSDFPWEKYPERVIPYTTARGCSWSKCDFCSDVKYVNGRTFRSFSIDRIISELGSLSEKHQTNLIAFTDLKLNSNVEVWNGLIERLPTTMDNPQWTCSVHVDTRTKNGLDLATLKKARAAGLCRISFGLESGSQRLLDFMNKGTEVNRLQQFIRDVCEAGISLRTTMFVGYPYETVEDLQKTQTFLEANFQYFDRIKLNRFHLNEMSPIYDRIQTELDSKQNDFRGKKPYKMVPRGKGYNQMRHRILKTVNQINAQPLKQYASVFEGIM